MTDSRTLPSPLVETHWLADELGADDLRIIDCSVQIQPNPEGGYGFVSARPAFEAGHIPGSLFIDLPTELSDPEAATDLMMPPMDSFAATMAGLGIGEGTRVVLYDRSNHAWAARVWWMLRTAGFDDAAVLNGGWQKWEAEARPASTEDARYPETRFMPRPRPYLMASKEDVLASLDDPATRRIYALPPAVYSGEVQLFARPGRIPASCNVYCEALIDPDSKAYLAKERMRALFQDAGAMDAEKVITYCGGGIAASSDALALVALGMENVAVYDGSMSEWTADPAMPLETE